MNTRCLAPLVALALSSGAFGQTVAFTFEAQVGGIVFHDAALGTNTAVAQSSLPGYSFETGQSVSGTFGYDRSTAPAFSDTNGTADGQLTYLSAGTFSFTVPAIGFSFAAPSGPGATVSVSDNSTHPAGLDLLQIMGSTLDGSGNFFTGYVSLLDSSGTAFGGFDLPSSLAFDAFGFRRLTFEFTEAATGNQMLLTADLTALAAVPEPATVGTIAGIVAFVFAFFVRRFNPRH